jgi:hypothetical protein
MGGVVYAPYEGYPKVTRDATAARLHSTGTCS